VKTRTTPAYQLEQFQSNISKQELSDSETLPTLVGEK